MDLAQIHQEFPSTARYAYLNTGSTGPLSARVGKRIQQEIENQILESRGSVQYYYDLVTPGLEDLRAQYARLIGADADEIALTHHTTEGLNIVVWGLPWQPGDEIVTTSLEHYGGLLPVYAAARRHSLRLRMVDLGLGDCDVVERIQAALSPRTRLVVLSQVMYTTGAVMPVADIAAAVHQAGGLLAVDGAQSVGAMPVDVRALGADFFTISGQKWLCGPEGVGALYVRRDHLDYLAPTFLGYASLRDPDALDLTGNFIPSPAAKRYEVATVLWPKAAGMITGLDWLAESVGWETIFHRTQAMTRLARLRLAAIPGVRIHSPEPHAGLTTFSVEGLAPEPTVRALAERGVVIRNFQHPTWLRASTGFFNTEDDLERLVDELQALRMEVQV